MNQFVNTMSNQNRSTNLKLSKALGIGLSSAGLSLCIYAIGLSVGFQDHLLEIVGLNLVLATFTLNLFFGSKFNRHVSLLTLLMGSMLFAYQAIVPSIMNVTYFDPHGTFCINFLKAAQQNSSLLLPTGETCFYPQQQFILASAFVAMIFVITLLVVGWSYRSKYGDAISDSFFCIFGVAGIVFTIGYNIWNCRALLPAPPVISLTPIVALVILGIALLLLGIGSAYCYYKTDRNA